MSYEGSCCFSDLGGINFDLFVFFYVRVWCGFWNGARSELGFNLLTEWLLDLDSLWVTFDWFWLIHVICYVPARDIHDLLVSMLFDSLMLLDFSRCLRLKCVWIGMAVCMWHSWSVSLLFEVAWFVWFLSLFEIGVCLDWNDWFWELVWVFGNSLLGCGWIWFDFWFVWINNFF